MDEFRLVRKNHKRQVFVCEKTRSYSTPLPISCLLSWPRALPYQFLHDGIKMSRRPSAARPCLCQHRGEQKETNLRMFKAGPTSQTGERHRVNIKEAMLYTMLFYCLAHFSAIEPTGGRCFWYTCRLGFRY